jgi:diguanylate cyclase (GGDEF)-like protein
MEIVHGADPPDLILVDVGEPELDGYKVCRQVKSDARSRHIPVIFVVDRETPTDEEYGLSLGAQDYIHKPLNPALLRTRVRNHLMLKSLSDTVARQATRDDLTGLANRRVFDRDFDREWSRARRLSQPIALAVLDLDHFRGLNDSYGFPMGDGVLRWLARIIDSNLRRPTDAGYRWGGEEFGIMLPETPAEGVMRVVERVREQLAHDPLPDDVPDRRATFSAGVAAAIPTGNMTGGDLLRRAEAALHQAKSTGRNRVVLWPGTR